MAKWWITDLAKVASGVYNFMVAIWKNTRLQDVIDITVTSIYAGSNEIMKQIIAKI